MSVLERFVRIRRFRAQATDYSGLASGALSATVRARYLAIADHYIDLAEAELRSDKLERKKRLAAMRAKRAAGRGQSTHPPAAVTDKPVKLRIIEGDGAAAANRRIRLPARSNLRIVDLAAKRER